MMFNLESWWEQTEIDSPSFEIPTSRTRESLSQLPPERRLDSEALKWLDSAMSSGNSLVKMMATRRAASIAGPSATSHQKRKMRLADLIIEADQLGIDLPEEFLILLQDNQLVNRMRFPCHWFQLPDFICSFPSNPSLMMVLFLCEEQTCNYTHLLLDRNGKHCIVRTGHRYGLNPIPPGCDSTDDEKKIFHYADSFAEFLCISADEIRASEKQMAESKMTFAEKFRQMGDHDSALSMYRIALSYDPESETVLQRIADYDGVQ